MNEAYRQQVAERARQGLPPLPLDPQLTAELVKRLQAGENTPELVDLLTNRIAPGVSPSAKIKAAFLGDLLSGQAVHPAFKPADAALHLGRMIGGYNIPPLVAALSGSNPAAVNSAMNVLSRLVFVGDGAEQVAAIIRKRDHLIARRVLEGWADRAWLEHAPALPDRLRLVVFKVAGEINTDDLSPAQQAPTRPDIPLHALSMGATRFPGGLATLETLRAGAAKAGGRVAFAGDVVGTGSSRKSAVNSLLWHIGDDIPGVPNKRRGGVVLGGRIAPIFRDTLEDAGSMPLTLDVGKLETGMTVFLRSHPGANSHTAIAFRLEDEQGRQIAETTMPIPVAESWRSGGRITRIVGERLAAFARAALADDPKATVTVPAKPVPPTPAPAGGYTLAQKLVGRACGVDGMLPGTACEPAVATVGSQDTTGPMTRDELEELACLRFGAGLVMQSFCHTAAYPTDRDRKTHQTLPAFMTERGGVALKPGDGIIHSWLNRLLAPDGVGTGGDSHTRFPLGISFPGGSGLVAFAAAFGFMPLTMPESVLVNFTGQLPPGLTWRDAANAIPLFAIQQGLMDHPDQGGRNVFNGRILEMEGLGRATVEEAFELTCASAERSAAASTVALPTSTVAAYLRSNAALIKSLIADGYQQADTLRKRLAEIEAWLAKPELTTRDPGAAFAATIPVALDALREPVVACPNNPDKVAWLSMAAGTPVDEVFLGSCMTHVGHFRTMARFLRKSGAALGVKRLWIAPPTRMDADALAREGIWSLFEKIGARLEIPGCSLCMGNQARVADGATVFSTSTRNFDNRMGAGAKVYLGSADLAAVVALLGRLPTPEEYFRHWHEAMDGAGPELRQPLDFSKIAE